MRLSLCLCLLLVSIMGARSWKTAASPLEISTVERIIQLRNQVRRDVDFLTDFRERRKNELSSQVLIGIATLKSHYENLNNETEPLVPSSGQPTSVPEEKLKPLAIRWSSFAVDTALWADSAKNTPKGENGEVTVRFKLYWKDELVDGWRVGGIGTLYVVGKDIEQEAGKICNESTLPDYAFLNNNFKFESDDKKWIEGKIRPGQWRMWTVHPADCTPTQIDPFVVPISRKPDVEYIWINLIVPGRKPKY